MSGTFSKYFYKAVENKTCADFLHPGLTCTEALQGTIVDALIGSLKFYIPICVIPFILKFKKWNHLKVWKDFIKDFGKCLLVGFSVNAISFTIICCSL